MDTIHAETLLSHQETGIDADTCFCSLIFGLQDTLSLSLDYRVVGQPSKEPVSVGLCPRLPQNVYGVNGTVSS